MPGDPPKVMIVNAYGRSNRGDSVLLDECIAEIRESLPGSAISCAVFEDIPAAQAVHPDVAWTDRIGNVARRGPVAKLVTLWRLVVAWAAMLPGLGGLSALLPRGQRATWQAIRDADVVISAPGGYIHDTNFAYYVALLHIHLGTIARARVVLAPQSIGPIEAATARMLARRVLSQVSDICPRESYSHAFLTEDLGLAEDNIRPAGDSAFWNDEVTEDSAAVDAAWQEAGFPGPQGRPVLGLSTVNWTFPKLPDMEAAREAYVQAMAQLIDHCAAQHGAVPVILNQVSDDAPMSRRIAEAAQAQVYVDSVSREPDILRAMIARSSVFVGTRFHSCIFAMMAGRPTQAVAYLPKTSFILKDLGLEHRQVDIDTVQAAQLIAAVDRDFADLPRAEAEIQGAVSRYRTERLRLRDVLAS